MILDITSKTNGGLCGLCYPRRIETPQFIRRWWHSSDKFYYQIELKTNKIIFSKHEGTKESWGGNSMPIKRYLSKEKWHKHIQDVYGKETYNEVNEEINNLNR